MKYYAPNLATLPEVSSEFDEHDEMKVGAVVPPEMVKSVQELLLSLNTAEMCERIGGLDKARAFDMIRPELERLRMACILRWRDL